MNEPGHTHPKIQDLVLQKGLFPGDTGELPDLHHLADRAGRRKLSPFRPADSPGNSDAEQTAGVGLADAPPAPPQDAQCPGHSGPPAFTLGAPSSCVPA
ncbi:hypothetical protein Pen02_59380 [Plantactinospora endophytica]|uniref:DUF2795 domain-containing protein n=1 Tax=Plantactinospora endophytica TaxID=673535 RepID=A0ABQ4E8E5_9ACTN|nr:hypothetical protein Pen02_59380 [Plantactinospora endophytica]